MKPTRANDQHYLANNPLFLSLKSFLPDWPRPKWNSQKPPETPDDSRDLDAILEKISRHDINTLTHLGERMKVVYDDPDGHDKLYRFMESIQEFFDLSGEVEVSFN